MTTQDKVVKLKTQSLTAYVNQHPVNLEFPVILDGRQPYVPASTLETLYPVTTRLNREYGIFLVRALDVPRFVGETNTRTVLRTKASPLARRVKVLPQGEQIVVYGHGARWLRVETSLGLCGFLPKNTCRASGKSRRRHLSLLNIHPGRLKATRWFWCGSRWTGLPLILPL